MRAKIFVEKFGSTEKCLYLCSVNILTNNKNMETTKRKRTREEVRTAFRQYMDNKKKRMEEAQRELDEIHKMRMSGMTMEEIFA
jgi:hypothetical protein